MLEIDLGSHGLLFLRQWDSVIEEMSLISCGDGARPEFTILCVVSGLNPSLGSEGKGCEEIESCAIRILILHTEEIHWNVLSQCKQTLSFSSRCHEVLRGSAMPLAITAVLAFPVRDS